MYKLLLSTTVALLIVGCGDSSQKEKKSEKQVQPQIKVTKNVVDTKELKKSSKANSGQFYYSYNKEKNETYNSEDSKRRTTLDAYLNIHSPYERVQVKLMIKKLSHTFAIKCAPCHDDYANGVIGPSLLGRDSDFIYKHIVAFKNGKKDNILMKDLVTKMDDSKLHSIANEIAEFNKQIQKMRRGKK